MKQIDEQETEPAREDYADEDEQVLTDMPTLQRPYKITEYIRKFMLRGRAIEGRTDYEAATCTAHLQH